MATLPLSTSWIARARQRFWRLAPGDREPVILRHSRIYILPTRRGFALIATLVIMLLTSMNYALSLGYAMTFVAAGMVAAALLATFRNLAGIASAPVAAGEAFAGGEVDVHAVARQRAIESASVSSSRRPTVHRR